MEVGVEVWLKDKIGQNAWVPAVISSKNILDNSKVQISVRFDIYSEESVFILNGEYAEIEEVKLRNSSADSAVEDLINLPYLHEPAILYCLEQRYVSSDIYTYTGPILIAVNPFKKVNLYTSQILEQYYNLGLLKSQGISNNVPLPPHVFAVADAAYRSMMNSILGSSGLHAAANQSILISGESGAGKTESTKIVLRYLTTVGNAAGGLELQTGSVMDKILQSNPILEAFGNAKTIRNDNSSRFGKFIELNFNRRGHLIGGTIRTYLLEKVRLPTQQLGERNFHIFYQMASGGSINEIERWNTPSVKDFWYTQQGGVFDLKLVNDKDEFNNMKGALNILNFKDSDQESLFNILAGLLHLGELKFKNDSDGEGSELSPDEINVNHLKKVSELFGISSFDIIRTLTVRVITARAESYEKKLTPVQASDAKDALAKAIYGKIFLWIVDTINISIKVDSSLIRADIGVLDIFGFECFKHNSFEQLCINYTNETLQQQFNQFIFKMEQIEYRRENIEWSFIEFPDNQDCLDLIEHKVNGILAMIDDECKLPKASDEKLAGRMVKALESHPRFSASVTQRRDYQFCIQHYAGPVVYNTITFVEKNKDELPRESFALLQTSLDLLLSRLFIEKIINSNTKTSISQQSSTTSGSSSVGSQFKEQLTKLMEKIYSTTPHYIRCLKPNDENVPDNFHRLRTTEQLRYGGVLEAVRVARSGFPVRLIHNEFFSRYRSLAYDTHRTLPHSLNLINGDHREFCKKLLSFFWINTEFAITRSETSKFRGFVGRLPTDSAQIGLTKVFLRKNAHDVLESMRSKRLVYAALAIQSIYRGFWNRKEYVVSKMAIIVLQKIFRGYLARKHVLFMRRTIAATIIQKYLRKYVSYKKYKLSRIAVTTIQRIRRGIVSRRISTVLKYNRNLIRLQKYSRGLTALSKFNKIKRAVISLQSRHRVKKAKNALRALKIEAKDLGNLRQNNENLKAEIALLRSKAFEESKKLEEKLKAELEARRISEKESEFEKLLQTIDELKNSIEVEKNMRQVAEENVKNSELEMTEILSALDECKYSLESEKKLRMMLEDKLEHKNVEIDNMIATLDEYTDAFEKEKNLRLSVESKYREAASEISLLLTKIDDSNKLLESENCLRLIAEANLKGAQSEINDLELALKDLKIKSLTPTFPIISSALGNISSIVESYTSNSNINVKPDNHDSNPSRSNSIDKKVNESAGVPLERNSQKSNDLISPDKFSKSNLSYHDSNPSRSNSSDKKVNESIGVPLEQNSQKSNDLISPDKFNKFSISNLSYHTPTSMFNTPYTPSSTNVEISQSAIKRSEKISPFTYPEKYSVELEQSKREIQSLLQQLSSEKASKSALEEEISRLREISMRLQAEAIKNSQTVTASKRVEDSKRRNSLEPPSPGESKVTSHRTTVRPDTTPVKKTDISDQDADRSRQRTTSAEFSSTAQVDMTKVLNKYEKNIDTIQQKLRKGIPGLVWEGASISKVDVSLILDPALQLLSFTQSGNNRTEIQPIKVHEILEVFPGANIQSESADDSRLLTIVCSSVGPTPRGVAFKVNNKEERNLLITGLRALTYDSILTSFPPQTSSENAIKVPLDPTSTTNIRSSRKKSVRDSVLEETISASYPNNGNSALKSKSSRLSTSSVSPVTSKFSADIMAVTSLDECRRLYLFEKSRNEKLSLQMFSLTNDLFEREELIVTLNKRESEYKQLLAAKDKLFEQDVLSKTQLGRKLEQVLMDKEEALEQIELLKEQLSALKESVAVINQPNNKK
eukprot:gene19020-24840_t